MTPLGILWEALSSVSGNTAHARSKRSQDGFADIDTCAARHSAADQCLHVFTYFSRSLQPLPAAVHDGDGRERGKDGKTTADSRARRRDKLFAVHNRCGDDRFGSWARVTGARRHRLFHNTKMVLLLVAAVGVLLPAFCTASRSAGGLQNPRSRLFCGAASDGSYMYADTCEQCTSQSPSACAGDCTWDAANARCMPAAGGLQTTRRQSTSSESGSGAGSASPGSSPASNITSTCGNARIESPETCDDGDATAGDGCSDKCTIECGFTCSSTYRSAAGSTSDFAFFDSICDAFPGDGLRLQKEECDDGNKDAFDGCLCTASASGATTTSIAVVKGGCVLEKNWECHPSAPDDIVCSSPLPLAGACKCKTQLATVTHARQPLKGLPARTETVESGYAGKSAFVRCKACACNHYGDCDTGSYCHSETTCSGHGFCDGRGECICLGNFTGPECNRCKCNHFGATCSVYCHPESTCGGHGVCDFDGSCLRSPMCDGVDLAAQVCGDGQRLGNEQCDDGNSRDGDGCSSSCEIEKGFKCLGGCTHTGDLSVTYGECQRDTCLPLPCGFHLTDVSLNFSRGALFVETPRFVVKTIIQDTPLPCQDNILRITLMTNVPIPTCIRTTRSVDEQAENKPWLTQRREITNLCVRSRITISGLTGITNEESPYGDEDTDPVLGDPALIRLRTMGALVEETGPLDYFGLCYSFTEEREDMGYCDEAVEGVDPTQVGVAQYIKKNNSKVYGGEAAIIFTVLKDIPQNEPIRFMLTVKNNNYRNLPLPLKVEMSGIHIAPVEMDTLVRESQSMLSKPLEIFGLSPPSSSDDRVIQCPKRQTKERRSHDVSRAEGLREGPWRAFDARASAGDAPDATHATATSAYPASGQAALMHAAAVAHAASAYSFASHSGGLSQSTRTSSLSTPSSGALSKAHGDAAATTFQSHASLAPGESTIRPAAAEGRGGGGGGGGGAGAAAAQPPSALVAAPGESTEIRRIAYGRVGGVSRSGGEAWLSGLHRRAAEAGPDPCASEQIPKPLGFCSATRVRQLDTSAGFPNTIYVDLKLSRSLPAGGYRITLTGLLSSVNPVLFAVTTDKQCAEQLPFGPSDALLPLPGEGGEGSAINAFPPLPYDKSSLTAVKKTGFSGATGFLSVFNANSMHYGFMQRLYDNDVLQFEIFWSFLSGPKLLRQRFEEAAGSDPRTEPVVWTIRDAAKREVSVKRGIWQFTGRFHPQGADGTQTRSEYNAAFDKLDTASIYGGKDGLLSRTELGSAHPASFFDILDRNSDNRLNRQEYEAGYVLNRFDIKVDTTSESSPDARGFSLDDGAWGAATGLGNKCLIDAYGALRSVKVLDGGSGYTSAPAVVFTGGHPFGCSNCSGASATAEVAAGAVTKITLLLGGSGYISAPTVSLTGGGGNGAGAKVDGAVKCGAVDGSVSPHTSNPIIQQPSAGGEPGGDFWGHGNFNQLKDTGCQESPPLGFKPCCSTYFKEGKPKFSEKIRNEMYFIPCPSCHCNTKLQVETTGSMSGNGLETDNSVQNNVCKYYLRKVNDPPLPVLLEGCGIDVPPEGWWDNPDPWYVSFGDSVGNQGKAGQAPYDWTAVKRFSNYIPANELFSSEFRLTNPSSLPDGNLSVLSAITQDIIATPPANESAPGYPYVKSFPYFESAAEVTPARLEYKVVRQTNHEPGQLNNITILLRPTARFLPNSRILLDALFDPSFLFLRTTNEACSGAGSKGLPWLPNPIPLDDNVPFGSSEHGNRTHTSWLQEVHTDMNDGQGMRLLFSISWLFATSKTLNDRIDTMASLGGEGVTWHIFSPEGRVLAVKRGSWIIPRKPKYWPKNKWAIDALWGASNGFVGGLEGSYATDAYGYDWRLPKDFWGVGWIDSRTDVWCEVVWMEGVPYYTRSNKNLIRLETSPMLSLPVGKFTSYRLPTSGRLVLVSQTGVDIVSTQITITTVNPYSFRNNSQPRLAVQACTPIGSAPLDFRDSSLSASIWPEVTIADLPLYVSPSRILFVRMNQNSYFPTSLNTFALSFSVNIHLSSKFYAQIKLGPFAGAVAPPGKVDLVDSSSKSGDYLLFSHALFGPAGSAYWDDSAKTITIYLIKDILPNKQISVAWVLENPLYPQEAPAMSMTLFQGLILTASVQSDFELTGDEQQRRWQPLRVIQPLFTDSTEMRQEVDNPGSLNRLHVFFGIDSDLRRSSRSHAEEVLTISNMRGAWMPSGAMNLTSPALAPDGITPNGASDSASYFKDGPTGTQGYGKWDNERKELKLWLARDWPLRVKLGISFLVFNDVAAQAAPNITLSTSSGVTVLFGAARSPCWPRGGGPLNPLPALPKYPGGYCLMPTHNIPPPAGVGAPLEIMRGRFTTARIGQSSPYPAAINTLTVTLTLNIQLAAPGNPRLPDAGQFGLPDAGRPIGVSIVFAGLAGASAPHFDKWWDIRLAEERWTPIEGQDARCLSMSPHATGAETPYGSTGFANPAKGMWIWRQVKCLEVQGPASRFFKPVGKWDNSSKKTLEVFVMRETPRNGSMVLSFDVVNNKKAQASANITVRTTGILVAETLLVKDSETNLALTRGIYQAKPGDAHPLLVYMPRILVKAIGQTVANPGALNSLIVTLSVNVDMAVSSDLFAGVSIELTGFRGGESFDGLVKYSDPGPSLLGNESAWYSSSLELLGARDSACDAPPQEEVTSNASAAQTQADGCKYTRGFLRWDGTYGLKTYVARLMQPMLAGKKYLLKWDIVNPITAQDSPTCSIEFMGIDIAKQPMDPDTKRILPNVYEPQSAATGFAAPLKIIKPRFVVKNIGHTTSLPGQVNTLQVTVSWNVDLYPRGRRCRQLAFAGFKDGEDGFEPTLMQLVTGRKIFSPIPLDERDSMRKASGLSYHRLCSAPKNTNRPTKNPPGTICLENNDCQFPPYLKEDANSWCVETQCHEDEWVPAAWIIEGLKGVSLPSGSVDLRDFKALENKLSPLNSSDTFFADNEGKRQAGSWSAENVSLRFSVVNTTQAGRNYSLEFTLQNMLVAQTSPPIMTRMDGGDLGSEAMLKASGDAAPLTIQAIQFVDTYTRIGQSTRNPFALNTITLTLNTNFPLQKGSRIRIMPFAGGSMEGVDEFTPPAPPSADGRVRTSGPDAYVFTALDSCADWCDPPVDCVLGKRYNFESGSYSSSCWPEWSKFKGTANFDPASRILTFYNSIDLEANSSRIFSFPIRNPGSAQKSPSMAIAIQLTETIDGKESAKELPFNVLVRDPANAPLTVDGALFLTKRIGQSVPYPSVLNNIGVTLSFNVPIPALSRSKLTISGLRGAMPVNAYAQSSISGASGAPGFGSQIFPVGSASDLVKCTGLVQTNATDCRVFGLRDAGIYGNESISCSARINEISSDIEIHITKDVEKETEYAFVLTVRNPAKGSGAVPMLGLQGKVPIFPPVLMDRDASTNLENIEESVHSCSECQAALPYWHRWAGELGVPGAVQQNSKQIGIFPSAKSMQLGVFPSNAQLALPLSIAKLNFLSTREGQVRVCGLGEACGGLIWQSDPNPGAPQNVIRIKIGVSVPLLAGASLHVRGLANAVKTAGVYPLVAPIIEENIVVKGTVAFKRCETVPLQVSGQRGGAEGTWQWVAAEESAVFYLLTDMAPGVWYLLAIELQNPLMPQPSPTEPPGNLVVEARSQGSSEVLQNRMATPPQLLAGEYPVLKIDMAGFIVKKIGQETAMPSAVNRISITIATNVPLREGTCVKLVGFSSLPVPGNAKEVLLGSKGNGPKWMDVVPTPADLASKTREGAGYWDGDAFQICLVKATVQGEAYVFSFGILNPAVLQDPVTIKVQTTERVIISRIDMDPDKSDGGTREPLRILKMQFTLKRIGQYSSFPAAKNTITVTLATNLPISEGLDLVIRGLTRSRSDVAALAITCDKGCKHGCAQLNCSLGGPLATPMGGCCYKAPGSMCTINSLPCLEVSKTCAAGAVILGSLDYEESGECCDSTLYGAVGSGSDGGLLPEYGKWDFQSGVLALRVIRELVAARQYTFSFALENVVTPQPSPNVFISLRDPALNVNLIDSVLMEKDAIRPPLLIDGPKVLLAAAKQSNSNPCSENTITVTLALNVPVRKGLRIELWGLDGAQYGTPEGALWPQIDIAQTADSALSEFSIRGTTKNISEILSFKLTVERSVGQSFLWLQVAPGEGVDDRLDLIPEGVPFAFAYTVFNPRAGQLAPRNFRVRAFNAALGQPSSNNRTLSPLQFKNLSFADITGCATIPDENSVLSSRPASEYPGSAVPLFVFSPRFDVLRMAQSNSAPRAANVMTVTFSTNVPLLRRCQIVISITGLKNISSDLPIYTQPGQQGTKWRSDACPRASRQIITLQPASAEPLLSKLSRPGVVTNVSVYGGIPALGQLVGTPTANRTWHARGGAILSAPRTCGLEDAQDMLLASCAAPPADMKVTSWGDAPETGVEGMCLYDAQLYRGADTQEWQRREALLALFRGQEGGSSSYTRSRGMPGLGDGVCDSAWNCDAYAWDMGDCREGERAGASGDTGTDATTDTASRDAARRDIENTAGTAAWNAQDEAVVIFLREDTKTYTEYAFSFQLTNPSKLSQALDIRMQTTGIRIAPTAIDKPILPFPNAVTALCSTGAALFKTPQGDLIPRNDATPLNTYSAALVETRVAASTTFPGAVNTITVTIMSNVLITPRLKMLVTVMGLQGAMWTTGRVQLSSPQGHASLFQAEIGGNVGKGYWDNERKELRVSIAGVLKEYVPYTFSFVVVNPPYGQNRPPIYVGSSYDSIGLATCAPWARPVSSTRIKLTLFNTSNVFATGGAAGGDQYSVYRQVEKRDQYSVYRQVEKRVRFTLRSLEDSKTVIHGCSVPVDYVEGILVPYGDWAVDLYSEGVYNETFEFRSSLHQLQGGLTEVRVATGTACGSNPRRSLFQDCMWWDKSQAMMVTLFHNEVKARSARVLLFWGDTPKNMDLSVQFKNAKTFPNGPRVYYPKDRASCKYGDVHAGGSEWAGGRSGGGVWWGCRSQLLYGVDNDGNPLELVGEVTLQQDFSDGFGPEIVWLKNPVDGEYHITVKVAQSPPTEAVDAVNTKQDTFIGAEEVRVYLPDGSTRSVFTSKRGGQPGMFWKVGFMRVTNGVMTWHSDNYDQLAFDPETLKSGYKLTVRVKVFSTVTAEAIDEVSFKCYSSGSLANAGTLISRGTLPRGIIEVDSNLPRGTIEIDNQVYQELAAFNTIFGKRQEANSPLPLDLSMVFPEQEYRIVLSSAGYHDVEIIVKFSGRVFKQDAKAYMTPVDFSTYVTVSWNSKKDLDIYVLPCANTGDWDIVDRETQCVEGPLLGAVYWGCMYYKQRMAPSQKDGLGLKWKDVGSEKPSTGTEIKNEILAAALQKQVDFKKEEWDKFQVPDLSSDSYIKVGNRYFKPAETGRAPMPITGSMKVLQDSQDGTLDAPESIQLYGLTPGFYDVWVNSYTMEPFDGTERVEISMMSGDSVSLATSIHKSVYYFASKYSGSAANVPTWWHVGFINRTAIAPATGSALPYINTEFVALSGFGSSPTGSGCRIYRPGAQLKFVAGAAGGGATLPSGISVRVAAGALGNRRAASVTNNVTNKTVSSEAEIQMSITQLEVTPAKPPNDCLLGSPVIYLEPSGTSMSAPGANLTFPISMPVDAAQALDLTSPNRAAVFRLNDGNWKEIPSSNVMSAWKNELTGRFYIEKTVGNTLSFSAYALMLVAKPPVKNVTTPLMVRTTPPPTPKPPPGLDWLLLVVTPMAVALFIVLMLMGCFRWRYGYFPCCKPPISGDLDDAIKPQKVKGLAALRLKLHRQSDKSRNSYANGLELSRETGELALIEESRQANDMLLVAKKSKVDPKHGDSLPVPPHPISELVRSGILMAPRSSVVDGANRKMLNESGGAGAPEKLQSGNLTVMADLEGGGGAGGPLGEVPSAQRYQMSVQESFIGKLGTPLVEDKHDGIDEPWFLSMHKSLGSMIHDGLMLSSNVDTSNTDSSSQSSSADSMGKRGLSTKRNKIAVRKDGPKGSIEDALASDDSGGDEVAV